MSAKDSSLTLLTDIDFTSEPYKRTFKVSEGSEELGCSGGTFLDHNVGQFQVEAILKVLTCTDGERSGSFIIRFHPSLVVTRWKVESATGDFTGLKGAGDFSVVENPEEVRRRNLHGRGELSVTRTRTMRHVGLQPLGSGQRQFSSRSSIRSGGRVARPNAAVPALAGSSCPRRETSRLAAGYLVAQGKHAAVASNSATTSELHTFITWLISANSNALQKSVATTNSQSRRRYATARSRLSAAHRGQRRSRCTCRCRFAQRRRRSSPSPGYFARNRRAGKSCLPTEAQLRYGTGRLHASSTRR